MAIRFVDKPDERPRRAAKAAETKTPSPRVSKETEAEPTKADATSPRQDPPGPESKAQAEGKARFATPIEAPAPANPDASSELPFAELPRAEKAARKKRMPKPKAASSPEEPNLT